MFGRIDQEWAEGIITTHGIDADPGLTGAQVNTMDIEEGSVIATRIINELGLVSVGITVHKIPLSTPMPSIDTPNGERYIGKSGVDLLIANYGE